jgi:hypothetical protein
MQKEELTKACEKEKKRLTKMLKDLGVDNKKILLLSPVIENTAWMRIKLDHAREKISVSGVAVPYDNGGGQTGIRENPAFKGYEALWKSYMTGMTKILDSLPAEVQDEAKKVEVVENPRTVLEIVRAKHKKEA